VPFEMIIQSTERLHDSIFSFSRQSYFMILIAKHSI
jgi:hypothetical protein